MKITIDINKYHENEDDYESTYELLQDILEFANLNPDGTMRELQEYLKEIVEEEDE